MTRKFLEFKDTISGQEGVAYAVINGENHELFYAKKIEGKVKKEKKEGKTLGKRGTQNKAIGYTGTGTLVVYYVTPLFTDMILKYMKTGVDTYFDLLVTNDDPNSAAGKQSVVLKNCNLDEGIIALLDVESEALEQDMEFTFDDADKLESFIF
ncbi:MAG: phage tail tube protein [Clostridium sp.]